MVSNIWCCDDKMGVKGLKMLIRPVMQEFILKDLVEGKRVGVDLSYWIHSLAMRSHIIYPLLESKNYGPLVDAIKSEVQSYRKENVELVLVLD